jgi:hypothetical protein
LEEYVSESNRDVEELEELRRQLAELRDKRRATVPGSSRDEGDASGAEDRVAPEAAGEGETADSAIPAIEDLLNQVEDLARELEDATRERPVLALLAALALGIVIGKLSGRR